MAYNRSMTIRYNNRAPIGAAALAALLLAAGCAEDERQGRDVASRPTRVIVEALAFEPVRTRVEAVGTSRAVRSVDLHPAVSGEVVAINFEPGQRVKKGDLLVELDQRDERLAVDLARVRLADAERLYERYEKSAESGAVLPTTIDAARTAVEAARIELDKARIALDFRTIEAPFDGYVGITEVDAGDRIGPDAIITTLDDRSALLVTFEIPEALIGELVVGSDVSLATWQRRDQVFSGKVVDIGSRIDPATRTFVARARVDNDADRLRPGMSFRVEVDIEGQKYPVIAETAVQWGADGAYIWSVVDGEARRVPVDIVQRTKGRVLIDAPLKQGDLIVVEGIQRMREGSAVEYSNLNLASDALGGGTFVGDAARAR